MVEMKWIMNKFIPWLDGRNRPINSETLRNPKHPVSKCTVQVNDSDSELVPVRTVISGLPLVQVQTYLSEGIPPYTCWLGWLPEWMAVLG